MTMTSRQVLDIIGTVGQAGTAGRVQAARRFTTSSSNPYDDGLSNAQRDLLKATGRVQTVRREVYRHPSATAPPAPAPRGSDVGPVGLTAAQIAWLDRLPSDPSRVPFDDAVELVRLARTITSASDKPLVRSHLQPVLEYHDAKAAEVDLVNAKAPLPQIPHEALAALADAIAAETPALTPDEAVQRASLALRDTADQRRAQRDQQADTAQRVIDAHEAAVADRLAVHR